MDRTLTSFIAALRNAEVRVSPAETLDAMSAVEICGIRDRELLKNTLALVLPKTPDEKETFNATFEQFFKFEDVSGETALAESETDSEGGDGDGSGDGQGDGTGTGSSGKGKRKNKFSAVEEIEEEEDLGPGETSLPQSRLGQLLMQDSRVELTVEMAEAAKEVDLEDIQVFTQKGLYTRKIMEAMGLADLQREITDAKESQEIPRRRLGQELKKRRDW